METAYLKASAEKKFIAFYLHHFQETEQQDLPALLGELQCSEEELYRLGLCLMPDPLDNNFAREIQEISAAVPVEAVRLSRVLRRADNLIRFSTQPETTMLLAARDKTKKD